MTKQILASLSILTLTALTAGAQDKAAAEKKAEPAKTDGKAAAAATEVVIGVIPNMLKYDKTEFTVKPGEKVKLTLKNDNDLQPHNICICKPGSVDKVSNEVLKAITNPDYMTKMNAFPVTTDILFKNNQLVGPAPLAKVKEDSFEFTAPADEGDYPYICTFPGHNITMRGVMKVKK